MSVTEFGRVVSATDSSDSKLVHRIAFSSPCGNVRAAVITFGATLQSVELKKQNMSDDDDKNNNNNSDDSDEFTHLCLGFETLREYQDDPAFVGATVFFPGRVKNSTFPKSYLTAPVVDNNVNNNRNEEEEEDGLFHLTPNENSHCLHGGPLSWNKRVWDFDVIRRPQDGQGGQDSRIVGVELRLRSPHLDNGFPGALDVRCRYFFDERSRLVIDLSAALAADSPTSAVCNMTNHAYWNLAGIVAEESEEQEEASATAATTESGGGAAAGEQHSSSSSSRQRIMSTIMNHTLHVPHGRFFLPTDHAWVQTGEVLPTAGTALDFTAPRVMAVGTDDDPALHPPGLEKKFGGISNFVLLRAGNDNGNEHRDGDFRVAAILKEPVLKEEEEEEQEQHQRQRLSPRRRVLTIDTTCAGVQLYGGNYLPRDPQSFVRGHGGALWGYRSALCIECSQELDAVNNPHFAGASCEVRPGETWRQVTRVLCSYE